MHTGRHLSVVATAAPSVTKVARLPLSVAACALLESVYSGPTNQVPATWFAGDAGIRRLALQSDGPVQRGRRRVYALVFSAVSADQLECAAQQSLGVSQSLFGFTDCGAEIFATRWNLQRTDLGELLSISLYVFGDDRQGCGNGVVHVPSLARSRPKSRLPRWRRCRYRGHLCIR